MKKAKKIDCFDYGLKHDWSGPWSPWRHCQEGVTRTKKCATCRHEAGETWLDKPLVCPERGFPRLSLFRRLAYSIRYRSIWTWVLVRDRLTP